MGAHPPRYRWCRSPRCSDDAPERWFQSCWVTDPAGVVGSVFVRSTRLNSITLRTPAFFSVIRSALSWMALLEITFSSAPLPCRTTPPICLDPSQVMDVVIRHGVSRKN